MLDEIDVLKILDEMDAFRRNHQDSKNNPPDFCMRAMEAILARAAGFTDRNDWTDALKADPNTQYSKEVS